MQIFKMFRHLEKMYFVKLVLFAHLTFVLNTDSVLSCHSGLAGALGNECSLFLISYPSRSAKAIHD